MLLADRAGRFYADLGFRMLYHKKGLVLYEIFS
jgi:hypothetical protein